MKKRDKKKLEVTKITEVRSVSAAEVDQMEDREDGHSEEGLSVKGGVKVTKSTTVGKSTSFEKTFELKPWQANLLKVVFIVLVVVLVVFLIFKG